jgi:general secretion pathway protein D
MPKMKKSRRNKILFGVLPGMLLAMGLGSPAFALAQATPDNPSGLSPLRSPTMPMRPRPGQKNKLSPSDLIRKNQKTQEAKKGGESATNRSSSRMAQAGGTGGDGDIANVKAKPCKRRRGTFPWNFEKAKILDVLDQISRLTCRNFIVSSSVKANTELTIISRKPVTVDQAWLAFLAALEANDLSLVPAGPYYKVTNRKESRRQALPMYEDKKDVPGNDAYVTLVYQLQYTSKDLIVPLMKNLMGKAGDLQSIGNDLLLLSDSGSNIQRLIKVIEKVDVSGTSNHIHIVDIAYADVTEVQQKLNEIFDAKSGGTSTAPAKSRTTAKTKAAGKKIDELAGTPPVGEEDGFEPVAIQKIVADERTNKLIIIASNKSFERIKEMIDLLDVPASDISSQSKAHVYYLNNADAQKVASTLSSLAQGSSATSRTSSKKKGGKAAQKQAQAAQLFEGEVKVTADESTNSLVIVSSARDYVAMTKLIEQLDRRRPQVFVEAVIMEVSMTEGIDYNLKAFGGYTADVPGLDGPGFGIVANEGGKELVGGAASSLATTAATGGITSATNLGAAAGLANFLGFLAFRGPEVPGSEEALGFPVPSFGAVLDWVQTNGSVNVLSTPHLLTVDNEKAEISVGQRVPVLRGATSIGGANTGFGIPLQQVAYEDVKLKFAITPHVNEDDEVRLELEQEVSDLGEQQQVGPGLTQPTILNRTAKTTIVSKDQQTLVIGGLITDRHGDSERKIPILGDIPIIGWLFKSWSGDKEKRNLLIVLTPYIVRTDDDFEKIYTRKMKERREFVEAFYFDAAEYDPYVDYEKKTGPLGRLVGHVDHELRRAENGGPGLPGETIITPVLDDEEKPEDGADKGKDESSESDGDGASEEASEADGEAEDDASESDASSDASPGESGDESDDGGDDASSSASDKSADFVTSSEG